MARSIQFATRIGQQAGRSLLDLVLPPVCRLCNEPISEGDFCGSCQRALTAGQPLLRAACRRCGVPGPRLAVQPFRSPDESGEAVGVARPEGTHPGCVHCRRQRFRFDEVVALWPYRDLVCDAIVAAKRAHRSPLADALGRRLAVSVGERLSGRLPDRVTFVPSHLTRQLSRGGNASETIATAVGRQIGRPCRPLLRVTRRIAKQAWLDDAQRAGNVRGAFALKRSYALGRGSPLARQRVLLVDDVLTTGATADEIARVLLRAGASGVSLAVVARALRS